MQGREAVTEVRRAGNTHGRKVAADILQMGGDQGREEVSGPEPLTSVCVVISTTPFEQQPPLRQSTSLVGCREGKRDLPAQHPRTSVCVMITATPSVSNCGLPARPTICRHTLRSYSR